MRSEERITELPAFEIFGGVACYHAAKAVLARRDKQPVTLFLLHPENLRVAEVILGIVLRSEEHGFGLLDPDHAVGARGVHHALLALSAVAVVVVASVEEVVASVGILNYGASTERRVGVGHLTEAEHHAVILVVMEVRSAILIDGVIALAIVIRIVEVVKLQCAVLGNEGHRIARVAALRNRIEVIGHGLVRLVREST